MTYKLNNNVHKFLRKNNTSKNYLVTIATGNKFYNDWKKFCLNSWKKYCKKNNLGLLVIKKEFIPKRNLKWKKPTWQRLLIAKYIKEHKLDIKNICVLDSDILINKYAPNIFNFSNLKKISVVNFIKNLPHLRSNYDLRERIVYLRRLFMDRSYPLRSSITASPQEIYKSYKFKKKFTNYFCAGVMVYNVNMYYNFFEKIYLKYCEKKHHKRFRGVEVPLNYEILRKDKTHWLDYKFQSIWLYELADKYSFVYREKKNYNLLVKLCAEEIVLNSFFLHFPGTLQDSSKVWKIKNFFENKKLDRLNKFFNIRSPKLKPKFRKIFN